MRIQRGWRRSTTTATSRRCDHRENDQSQHRSPPARTLASEEQKAHPDEPHQSHLASCSHPRSRFKMARGRGEATGRLGTDRQRHRHIGLDDVKATVEGLKLQTLSEGRCEHKLGVSAVEPAKPFCAVNVSIVDPDWPGLVITMVVGFAAIANPAPKFTEIACEVDP